MTRLVDSRFFTTVFLLLFLQAFSRTGLCTGPERPNIIFILSDDHAYQAIGAYGNKLARTPNIDRIAREGALFQNMFVANSICGPSRATLLTGKYSHQNGYKTNSTRTPFNIDQQIFPRIMSANGYQTAWIGKWHLETLPKGFDYWQVPPGQGYYYNPDFIGQSGDTTRYPGYISDVITKFSVDWLEQRDKQKPFMMVIGEKATHRNWLPDLQDLGAYDDVEFLLPASFNDSYDGRAAAEKQDLNIRNTMKPEHDLKVHADWNKEEELLQLTEEQRRPFKAYYDKLTAEFDRLNLSGEALRIWKYQRYMRDYMSVANSLDRNIGAILDYLDKTGLAKNTIVIYASDQGFYTGEHGWFDKRFMYEESFRTPFVMRYPGVVKAGSMVKQLMINIDWAPTILDAAGIAAPSDMQGRSFMPVVSGKQKVWRDEVYYHYYEYPSPHRVQPHFGVRSKRYKLIRFYGPSDFWELYDLANDPGELVNQYTNPKYQKMMVDMKAALNKQISGYRDDEAAAILAKENAGK